MYQRILVATDGSATSASAVTAALALAKQSGAHLRLVYVIEEFTQVGVYESFGYAAGLVESLKEHGLKVLAGGVEQAKDAGVDADFALLDQPGLRLGDAVCSAAKLWGADLLVVGTHGRRGVNRFIMGSGAEQIIRQAPVHVLVVRDSEGQDEAA